MKRIFELSERSHGEGDVQLKWQKKTGNYLATVGVNRSVQLWDRHGKNIDQIDLAGLCVGMDWSADGSLLAVIDDKTPTVVLWHAHTKKRSEVNTMEKSSLTFLCWSKLGLTLAVGGAKGNLNLYNHQTGRRIPILGKHGNKPITCGAWSDENTLCLGGRDETVSLTNENGDTLQQMPLDGIPSNIQFFHPPDDPEETIISMVLNNESFYLWKSSEPEAPSLLEFQPKYGKIVTYEWFGDTLVLLGFQNGYCVVISAKTSNLSQEMALHRNHRRNLADAIVSPTLNKVATCGDDTIKIHDLTDTNDVYATITLEDDADRFSKLEWSDDGQLLSLALTTGGVKTFLTKLPMLGESCKTMICHLSALQELTVAEPIPNVETKTKINLPIEPSFVAVGPYHVAAGFNNQAYIYALIDNQYGLVAEQPRSYFGTIDQYQLNADYAAVLSDGVLTLHEVEDCAADYQGEREPKSFPEKREGARITCYSLTDHFCIHATDNGVLKYFMLEDWTDVNEYRHVCGIRQLLADPTSTRLLFLDDKGDVFLYNPVTDQSAKVSGVSPTIEGILWDNESPDGTMGFILYDATTIQVYSYDPEHYQGPQVTAVGTSSRGFGTKPLMLYNGTLTSLMPSGKHKAEMLATHELALKSDKGAPVDCVEQNIKLKRYGDAFVAALKLPEGPSSKDTLSHLYDAALKSTDIATAVRTAQLMGDPAKSQGLTPLVAVEDRRLLCGHVALLYNEFSTAEKMFLSSSKKVEALNMNRDLLRWEKALEQANALAPKQIPYISLQYAQQLEFTGNVAKALEHYNNGVTGLKKDSVHDLQCKSGQARMLIRRGEMRQGTELASEIDSPQLWRECAFILQGMGQGQEAAEMYVKGRQFDKAAQIYIKIKAWKKVAEILDKVQAPALMVQYAKAREAEGSFKEAADAYQKAKEYDAVVRISLEKLRDPDRAVEMVTISKSVEGAKMVAKFFMGLGDASSAIRFLVMSGAEKEAFKLAQTNGKMDVFAEVLGDDGAVADYENVATYFENADDKVNAGRFFIKCKNYARAIQLLLSVTEDGSEHIDLAIAAVGGAQDDKITEQVIDYLMGEVDGVPKDAKFLFNLYIALKQYPEAARTAVIIAREDQTQGNYRGAHDVLFNMYQRLTDEDIRIPNDMANNLMILHSYTLVKLHIRLKDNEKAARMLVRVANVISSFPAHVVNILTSTVIYCWKAGMKNSAFSWAAMLMRPEYRKDIEPKYKTKVENMVRKPDKSEVDEGLSDCPFCGNALPCTQLDCSSCGNILPYCVITGRHMVTDDWCTLPCCKMPALLSEASVFFMNGEEPCPMCQRVPALEEIRKENDTAGVMRKYKHQLEPKSSEA